MESWSNPDVRPLPPGWYQHFDTEQQSWYYVQINVLPPKVSYTHPASLTPRSSTPPSSESSGIRNHTPVPAKLSAAQQLYASAINKRNISPGLESSTAKIPRLSASSDPSAQQHTSRSRPMYISFENAQPPRPTGLYNETVFSQARNGQALSPDLRTSVAPQLDVATRMSKTPIIAIIARPPSVDQRSHPDTLTSPPLYASSGPSYRKRSSSRSPALSLLTPPNSPPTYHGSPQAQGTSHVAANHSFAPDQSQHQQYSTRLTVPNQPSGAHMSTVALPETYFDGQGQAQYHHQPTQISSQQLNQDHAPAGVQGTSTGLQIPPPQQWQATFQQPGDPDQQISLDQLNQIKMPMAFQQQLGTEVSSQPLNRRQAPATFQSQSSTLGQQVPPQQLNQSQGDSVTFLGQNIPHQAPAGFQRKGTTPFQQIPSQQLSQSQAPTAFQQQGFTPDGQEYALQYSQSSAQLQAGQPSPHQLPRNYPPPVMQATVPPAYENPLLQYPPPQAMTQYLTYGRQPPIYQGYQVQLQSPPSLQSNISGLMHNTYDSRQANARADRDPRQAQR